MEELAPGLRRFAVWHDHWEEEVGWVAVDTADGLVLIDPLDPPAELRAPAHVLYTVFWHARDGATLQAGRIWAGSALHQSARELAVSRSRTSPSRRRRCRAGIEAFQTPRASEVVYWLPEQRALVVGDVLLGAGAKPRATDDPLRLCPERWLGKGTHADLRESLRPLLDLPVEHVLVSHGLPVLEHGKRELARMLG